MKQRTIQFEPVKESQAERCRRVLAGTPKLTTASELTFTEPAARRAAQLAKAER